MHASAAATRVKTRYVLARIRDDPGAAITDARRPVLRVFPRPYFLRCPPPRWRAVDTWPLAFEPFGDRVREPSLHAFSFLDSRQELAANTVVATRPSLDGRRQWFARC